MTATAIIRPTAAPEVTVAGLARNSATMTMSASDAEDRGKDRDESSGAGRRRELGRRDVDAGIDDQEAAAGRR